MSTRVRQKVKTDTLINLLDLRSFCPLAVRYRFLCNDLPVCCTVLGHIYGQLKLYKGQTMYTGADYGFSRGRGKIFEAAHEARKFCFASSCKIVAPPTLCMGATIYYLHSSWFVYLCWNCIFSKTVSPNNYTGIKWWYLSISTSRLPLARLWDICMERFHAS